MVRPHPTVGRPEESVVRPHPTIGRHEDSEEVDQEDEGNVFQMEDRTSTRVQRSTQDQAH